jgi:predicted nucleic acid-binding protein
MEQKYLIDTNIIIDFSENKLPATAKSFISKIIDDDPSISVINKIELLSFSVANKVLTEFTEVATVIGLTDDVVNRTIALRKSHRIKLPDAIIAATALAYNYKLVTRDTNDFKNIKGLKVINPWTL